MRRAVVTLALLAAAALAVVWAQGGFEALARSAAEGQRAAQNAMAGVLRALRAGEPGALAGLLGLAFSYGVMHAVGPGHGKVVIGGYGAATAVRLAPLVVIALAASLAQATTAVLLVHGGVALFDLTRTELTDLGEGALTQAGTAAIAVIGLWLAWRGMRALVGPRLAAPVPARGKAMAHGHGAGGVCDGCGHRHAPGPEDIAGLRGWRDAALLIGAIAVRPCTGALFLLILTWRMGIGGAGILATYVMGLGTAVVTVGTAALAVLARDGALDWAGRLPGLRAAVPAAQVAAGLAVALVAFQALRLGL